MKLKTIILLVLVIATGVSLYYFEWNLKSFRGVATGFVLGFIVSHLIAAFAPRRY